MKFQAFTASVFSSALMFFCRPVSAQTDMENVTSNTPVAQDEREVYNTVIAHRTQLIMDALATTDTAKSNRVQAAIMTYYHALKARDEAIDSELGNTPQGTAEWESQRLGMLTAMSKPLHDRFLATLSKDLTPAQVETVKDKMTYGKVDFTYKAYCSILPNLTTEEKDKILELLKQAREVAIDGGSAGEKSVIFQQYKDQINTYLSSHGYDVAKATQEWSQRQKPAQKAPDMSPAPAAK